MAYNSPSDYEGKTILVEGEEQYVPKFSAWEKKCSCCGINVAYFPVIKTYFINQWQCHPLYPAGVTTLFCLSFAWGMWSITESLRRTFQYVALAIFSLSFLFWFVSYYCAVCRSPGYLPFYWAVEKHDRFTYEQQMDGVITDAAQYQFANYNNRPERGSLSKQARRLVMKADHICNWIANWVGLKNYRYFFNMLIWSFVYFILFFCLLAAVIYRQATDGWHSTVCYIGMIVLAVPSIGFFGFVCVMIRTHVKYTYHNMTTLLESKMKQNRDLKNNYDLGCWRNCVQIFGPAKCCPCWFIPCIPIKRETDGFRWVHNDDVIIGDGSETSEDHVEQIEGQPAEAEFIEQPAPLP